jgi:hypothetical protein
MKGEEFYATLKLTSGEEIFSKVTPIFKEDKKTKEQEFQQLLLFKPVIIVEIDAKKRGNVSGYKMESWLKTTSENTFVINKCDVITLNESNDKSIIKMYETYLNLFINDTKNDYGDIIEKIQSELGLISTVDHTREVLERIWKNSELNT